MARVTVEFINTCPSCAGYENAVRSAASQFGDAVEVQIHQAGKDLAYLRKYGPVSKGTLIIDGRKKYDHLSNDLIRRVIFEAVGAEEIKEP
jgi:hypothetical protein